jgi:threonyl-tRNA synthetase
MAKTMDRKIEAIRHSLSHLMSMAIEELNPKVGLGVGPAIENGFYQDYDLPKTLTPDILPKLEKRMKELIKEGIKFEQHNVNFAEAYKFYKHDPYKTELIDELKANGEKSVSFYKSGNFDNLCGGPHIDSTKDINPEAFKLTAIAGAYWRGDEKNKMLQRIYGVAFESKKDLEEYLENIEEAKKRDHRKLGKDLDLYNIDDEVGNGLVLWHPKGALLWRLIENYWYDEHLKSGYDLVRSPHIGSRDLWEKSGHWGFYSSSMYPPLEAGQSLEDLQAKKAVEKSEQYLLKPMNCPFHFQIYKNSQHSYRDLPLRWAEMGDVYRFEKTGELSGLTRVRGFTQDDAHIICRKDQVRDELKRVIDFILDIYKAFGFETQVVKVYLSLRDPDDTSKFVGDDEGWEFAEKVLREVSDEKQLNYTTEIGEAAFYGPKLDFKVSDVIGREWQCSTLQFDFNMPQRFNMTFTNNQGQEERPYLLHRALFGSMERFIGLLIEHYGGAFPVWLAPEQLRLATVNQTDKIAAYADDVAARAKELGLRPFVDDSNESVGKKIWNAEQQKIPYTLVIGEKEVQEQATIPRIRKDLVVQEPTVIKIENLLHTIANEAKSHASHTSV